MRIVKINMKKISLMACSLLLVLILAGCNKKEQNDTDNKGEANQENQVMSNEDGESGIMKKLKSALSSGKKLKCTYAIDEEGNKTEVVTYVQGDKYRTEVILEKMKTISIFDGDAMYSWSENQKVGTKMTMECIDSLGAENDAEASNVPEGNSVQDGEEFIDTLADAQNLNCEDAGDISFEIPSDISFTDQCEMLKAQQKMLEKFE